MISARTKIEEKSIAIGWYLIWILKETLELTVEWKLLWYLPQIHSTAKKKEEDRSTKAPIAPTDIILI